MRRRRETTTDRMLRCDELRTRLQVLEALFRDTKTELEALEWGMRTRGELVYDQDEDEAIE